MKNYDNGNDDRYKDRNKDENYDNSAASGSGSDGSIFNLIILSCSLGGGLSNSSKSAVAAAHYVFVHRTIYLHYKDPIKDVP